MPCETLRFPNGGGAIICGGRSRRKKCFYCGRPSDWLCDSEADGKDCDRPICAVHRSIQGPNVDWCLIHVNADRRAEEAYQDRLAEEGYQEALANPPPIQAELPF